MNLIKKAYLHPIIFPSEVCEPQKIFQIYKRLYQIAASPLRQHMNQDENNWPQPSILEYQPLHIQASKLNLNCKSQFHTKRKNNSEVLVCEVNKWLLRFFESFVAIRIPRIKCKRQLRYWEWFASSYDFEEQLKLIKQKNPPFKSQTFFNWDQCKKFFCDKAFCLQIVQWTFAFRDSIKIEQKGKRDMCGRFIKILFKYINQKKEASNQIIRKPSDDDDQQKEEQDDDDEDDEQVEEDQDDAQEQQKQFDYIIEKPNEFINFQHTNCEECSEEWDQKNMKQFFPRLTHLFYAVRYKTDLQLIEKDVQRHSSYYTKKLKSSYEHQIQKKYKSTLFPEKLDQWQDEKVQRILIEQNYFRCPPPPYPHNPDTRYTCNKNDIDGVLDSNRYETRFEDEHNKNWNDPPHHHHHHHHHQFQQYSDMKEKQDPFMHPHPPHLHNYNPHHNHHQYHHHPQYHQPQPQRGEIRQYQSLRHHHHHLPSSHHPPPPPPPPNFIPQNLENACDSGGLSNRHFESNDISNHMRFDEQQIYSQSQELQYQPPVPTFQQQITQNHVIQSQNTSTINNNIQNPQMKDPRNNKNDDDHYYHINDDKERQLSQDKKQQQQQQHQAAASSIARQDSKEQQDKKDKSQVINLMSDQQNDRHNDDNENSSSRIIGKNGKNIEIVDLRNEDSDDQNSISQHQYMKFVHPNQKPSSLQMQLSQQKQPSNLFSNPSSSNIMMTGGNPVVNNNPYATFLDRLQTGSRPIPPPPPSSIFPSSLGIPTTTYLQTSNNNLPILGAPTQPSYYSQMPLNNYGNNIMKMMLYKNQFFQP